MKSVRIRSYSGPHFPAFGLNPKRYSLSLRIQYECGKMRARITRNTVTFYALIPVTSGGAHCNYVITELPKHLFKVIFAIGITIVTSKLLVIACNMATFAYFLKVPICCLKAYPQVSAESPLKLVKNPFHFTLTALFVLEIFEFLY